ncbi:response regulator [bacterium]|nr:MAG: response regulator [bacterium]
MVKKILIVDDSPISRKMLKSCIAKDADFEILEAADGLAGLELFREASPDLTFLDLTMPVMDGFQTLEEMKKHDPEAMIIVATADIQAKSIEKVVALGALHVLKKPPTRDSVGEAFRKASACGGARHGN